MGYTESIWKKIKISRIRGTVRQPEQSECNSLQERGFSLSIPGLGPTKLPIKLVLGVKRRGVKLTTHLRLALSLRTRGVILPLLHMSS